MYVHEECSNHQISLVHGGLACSSPTSTSSRESNVPTSWHDISDVSLSTVDHDQPKGRDVQRFLHKPNKLLSFSESHIENAGKKRTKNAKESQTKDSVNLEFVSLPGGESSHTFMPSYKDLGYTETSQSGNHTRYLNLLTFVTSVRRIKFCFQLTRVKKAQRRSIIKRTIIYVILRVSLKCHHRSH